MIPTGGLERSSLLLEQGRYDLAEKELRAQLIENHQDSLAHSLLAFCLMKQNRLAEAESEAREAISLDPDSAFGHFHLGQVLDQRDRLNDAAAAFREAVRLDPDDADSVAGLAGILVQQRRWDEAMEYVERGLEIEPDHDGCTNLRAMILTHTGRADEANATLEDALARDPENAWTHANRGWTLLRESRPEPAIEHFREALRLDPDMEYARIGIVEAMKARNVVYRPILRFFLWMGSLQGRAQMWLILGLFFGMRLLRKISETQPALKPVLYPVIFLYMAFVLMTWVSDPLFNLLLRLDKFGRLALSREQIRSSNWFGAALGVALVSLVAGLATGSSTLLLVALGAAALILPITAIFRCRPGWPRMVMTGYTVLLVLFMAGALYRGATAGFVGFALIGAVLSTWIGSGLSFARSRSKD